MIMCSTDANWILCEMVCVRQIVCICAFKDCIFTIRHQKHIWKVEFHKKNGENVITNWTHSQSGRHELVLLWLMYVDMHLYVNCLATRTKFEYVSVNMTCIQWMGRISCTKEIFSSKPNLLWGIGPLLTL